jgi:hypothetical protein
MLLQIRSAALASASAHTRLESSDHCTLWNLFAEVPAFTGLLKGEHGFCKKGACDWELPEG